MSSLNVAQLNLIYDKYWNILCTIKKYLCNGEAMQTKAILERQDLTYLLFKDLENVMPKVWEEKIWEMIWKRWEYYESFRYQR